MTWRPELPSIQPKRYLDDRLHSPRWRGNGLGWYSVRDFGAKGDGVTDDTIAIQTAITLAFEGKSGNEPGGTVYFHPGNYIVSSTLVTPANVAGSIAFVGGGRPGRGFPGGVSGDPVNPQGATITYTANAGDILFCDMSGGNKRLYITIDGLTFHGNSGGASGNGIHLKAATATSGILACIRDTIVSSCKQNGIYFDGNIFECQLINVRSNSNGDRGFIMSANGGGLPGEIRVFGSTFNNNVVGVDLSGGGSFSFYGLTATANSNEGFIGSGIALRGIDLNLEINGLPAGNQMTINTVNAIIIGVSIGVIAGGTGSGLRITGGFRNYIHSFSSNSGATGIGYSDITLVAGVNETTLINYSTNDGVNRLVGFLTGDLVMRGGTFLVPLHTVAAVSRGGNAALADLLTGLEAIGMIVDNSTP